MKAMLASLAERLGLERVEQRGRRSCAFASLAGWHFT